MNRPTTLELTPEQIAAVRGDALELTTHQRTILLPLALMHDLDTAHERYCDPSPWNTLRHNTRDAAGAVLALLAKIAPDAAASWTDTHGSPYEWQTGAGARCGCAATHERAAQRLAGEYRRGWDDALEERDRDDAAADVLDPRA